MANIVYIRPGALSYSSGVTNPGNSIDVTNTDIHADYGDKSTYATVDCDGSILSSATLSNITTPLVTPNTGNTINYKYSVTAIDTYSTIKVSYMIDGSNWVTWANLTSIAAGTLTLTPSVFTTSNFYVKTELTAQAAVGGSGGHAAGRATILIYDIWAVITTTWAYQLIHTAPTTGTPRLIYANNLWSSSTGILSVPTTSTAAIYNLDNGGAQPGVTTASTTAYPFWYYNGSI